MMGKMGGEGHENGVCGGIGVWRQQDRGELGLWKGSAVMSLRDKVEELLEGFGSITLIWQRRDKSERVLGH